MGFNKIDCQAGGTGQEGTGHRHSQLLLAFLPARPPTSQINSEKPRTRSGAPALRGCFAQPTFVVFLGTLQVRPRHFGDTQLLLGYKLLYPGDPQTTLD